MATAKAAFGSIFASISSTANVIGDSASYAEGFISEALEVQRKTRAYRVEDAVFEAKAHSLKTRRDLVKGIQPLTDEEQAALELLKSL